METYKKEKGFVTTFLITFLRALVFAVILNPLALSAQPQVAAERNQRTGEATSFKFLSQQAKILAGLHKIPQDVSNPSESPSIVAFDISTFHDSYSYRLDASAFVQEPQGLADIASVKAVDASGTEFDLIFQRPDGSSYFYYGNLHYGQSPVPLGITEIIVTDKSGHSATVSKLLTNVIEELPTILYPGKGDLIPETDPLFDWADVNDEESSIVYGVFVYKDGEPNAIWNSPHLSQSRVEFNFDGSASELLAEGKKYFVSIYAYDEIGNQSYDIKSFHVGSYLNLENEFLHVELYPTAPIAKQYILKSTGATIYGDEGQYYASIYYEGSFHFIYPAIDSVTKGSDRVCYHMRGELESKQVVTFDLCYILSENSIELTFGNVQETPGYKLIYVRTPFLLTVRADQGGAKLVVPYAEGRLIDVATTTSGLYQCDTGGWIYTMLMGMLYHQGALAICSYDHLDMSMLQMVSEDPDKGRVGSIDIWFIYRHFPTNFELAGFVNVFDEYTSSLSARLTFLSDYDGDGDIDWMDGAKYLRDQVQAVPDPKYLSSWMTNLRRAAYTSVSDHLSTLERLYHLTDHNKIYCYLLECRRGWPVLQFFGTDEDIDPNWTSLDGLIDMFRIAEKEYNVVLSLNDNYTEYRPGTPGYDPALRVIQADGIPMPGWPWIEIEQGYVADDYDYAVKEGLKRVRNILARYPIKESYHIDAFHFAPFRDYSLESPSSREKQRRGKNLIIAEFNKQGVTITGEGLTQFFVGPGTGWFLHIPRIWDTNLPFSDVDIIPLIEFIYHGKTLYGSYEGWYGEQLPPEQAQVLSFLEPLLLGASSGSVFDFWHLEVDNFYLIDLPWMALNQRYMQDYIAMGDYRRITYGSDTFVEINYKSNTYTVQVDGEVIGQDYTTFYPKDKFTYLIYSKDAKTVSHSLPKVWKKKRTHLVKLTDTGRYESVPFDIVDNKIEFNAEANTPYKLMRKRR